jgi:hypothetical protein
VTDSNGRREAALKAWKTRRRMAKPSPAMTRVLKHLASKSDARISAHGMRSFGICGVSLTHTYGYKEHRMTQNTLRAMLKRKWVELEKETLTGGLMGDLPDGSHGVVDPSFSRTYRLTDKGRSVIE